MCAPKCIRPFQDHMCTGLGGPELSLCCRPAAPQGSKGPHPSILLLPVVLADGPGFHPSAGPGARTLNINNHQRALHFSPLPVLVWGKRTFKTPKNYLKPEGEEPNLFLAIACFLWLMKGPFDFAHSPWTPGRGIKLDRYSRI